MTEEPKQKNLEQKIGLVKAEEPKPEKIDLAYIVCASLGVAYLGAGVAGTVYGVYYLIDKYPKYGIWMVPPFCMLVVAADIVITEGVMYALDKIVDRYKTTKLNN